jgi:transposase
VTPEGLWVVLSQSKMKVRYTVDPTKRTCTCPDFEEWELDCKHIFAVQFVRAGQDNEEVHVVRPTYQQNWSAYSQAQQNEELHFGQYLRALCDGVVSPEQKRGRPRLPLGDEVYAATLKVYTTFSGRRATTAIREYAAKGCIKRAPNHNSISNYLRSPKLTPVFTKLIEQSAAPLKAIESNFAIDATGFGTSTYDRWYDHQYGDGGGKRQRWLKAHAMVGTTTNIVTAIEVTEGSVGDATQLPDLVMTTSKHFTMKEVSADKAYLSTLNLMSIEAHGAQPFIPFKVNSQGGGVSAWQRMWHLFWFKRDEFLKHYHRRSNVESTFSAIKRKFGGSLRSKQFPSQVNELLAKILCHNIVVLVHEMYALGIDPLAFWAKDEKTDLLLGAGK